MIDEDEDDEDEDDEDEDDEDEDDEDEDDEDEDDEDEDDEDEDDEDEDDEDEDDEEYEYEEDEDEDEEDEDEEDEEDEDEEDEEDEDEDEEDEEDEDEDEKDEDDEEEAGSSEQFLFWGGLGAVQQEQEGLLPGNHIIGVSGGDTEGDWRGPKRNLGYFGGMEHHCCQMEEGWTMEESRMETGVLVREGMLMGGSQDSFGYIDWSETNLLAPRRNRSKLGASNRDCRLGKY
ncbi:hypothetical protein BU17DRAFT_63200 [Hysterangium stoloniferum]|nr:hypothetical protein BU17DRAFT_63200 [Hysterangium stoloniferum]